MSQKNKEKSWEKPAIEIDYDSVDVARIMDEIKKKITKQPQRDSKDVSQPPSESSAHFFPDAGVELSERPRGPRQRMKRLLLKVMSPFSPLIKLLVLPVYEEHRQTVLTLDNTNKRLDHLVSRLDTELERIREYTNLLHNLCHNIVVELSKLKIEEEMLKTKTQVMEKDFDFLGKRERALEKEVFK